MTENSDGHQPKPWQFQPGESGNPLGKHKGARHYATRTAASNSVSKREPFMAGVDAWRAMGRALDLRRHVTADAENICDVHQDLCFAASLGCLQESQLRAV